MHGRKGNDMCLNKNSDEHQLIAIFILKID